MAKETSPTIKSWSDDRKDWYEITCQKIQRNALSVAIISMKNGGVIDNGDGTSTLKTKNYGKLLNLCDCERFRDQPAAARSSFTGFLVHKDIIATAGHSVSDANLEHLRVLFGFKMVAPSKPITTMPNENIYKVVEILAHKYDKESSSDWALVKLDRKVKNQNVATLSRDIISPKLPVYVIGHPWDLPLKYAGVSEVVDISDKDCFAANLNIYQGNGGSPIFNGDTHEVIGIAARGYECDFEYNAEKRCMVSADRSIQFRNGGAQCTRISDSIDILESLKL
jgi:V8-like Glu-specific endopeptidase